jgi:hypothetical protein
MFEELLAYVDKSYDADRLLTGIGASYYTTTDEKTRQVLCFF